MRTNVPMNVFLKIARRGDSSDGGVENEENKSFKDGRTSFILERSLVRPGGADGEPRVHGLKAVAVKHRKERKV